MLQLHQHKFHCRCTQLSCCSADLCKACFRYFVPETWILRVDESSWTQTKITGGARIRISKADASVCPVSVCSILNFLLGYKGRIAWNEMLLCLGHVCWQDCHGVWGKESHIQALIHTNILFEMRQSLKACRLVVPGGSENCTSLVTLITEARHLISTFFLHVQDHHIKIQHTDNSFKHTSTQLSKAGKNICIYGIEWNFERCSKAVRLHMLFAWITSSGQVSPNVKVPFHHSAPQSSATINFIHPLCMFPTSRKFTFGNIWPRATGHANSGDPSSTAALSACVSGEWRISFLRHHVQWGLSSWKHTNIKNTRCPDKTPACRRKERSLCAEKILVKMKEGKFLKLVSWLQTNGTYFLETTHHIEGRVQADPLLKVVMISSQFWSRCSLHLARVTHTCDARVAVAIDFAQSTRVKTKPVRTGLFSTHLITRRTARYQAISRPSDHVPRLESHHVLSYMSKLNFWMTPNYTTERTFHFGMYSWWWTVLILKHMTFCDVEAMSWSPWIHRSLMAPTSPGRGRTSFSEPFFTSSTTILSDMAANRTSSMAQYAKLSAGFPFAFQTVFLVSTEMAFFAAVLDSSEGQLTVSSLCSGM